ncbi:MULTISPECIES: sugar porter family MFS transporter [Prauserella salsuginis group]|uniref:Sugar porter family MFS transporter n=1 Tax=Prauserella salsuginis TaxID=387889 RepID=A0ABW6G0V7_9PSEU|nr:MULTISPECIES: sugar porter family MFS transporter [Prauserella salsuginis group]MCR3721996.1 MFS transporter, sugar porter (SP) family [Prauserella flava]MCR3736002.1 MFS transporter, sugar porter (SP) family [Prauserella salsuginis]
MAAAPTRVPRPAVIYFFGALGGILFGYETGIIAGALAYIHETPGFEPNAVATGLIVGGISLGAIAGALLAGKLADRVGRRRVILGLGAIFIIGSIACAVAPDNTMLIIARVFLGLGVGGSSALVPVYMSEMAPARMRGRLAGLNQLMIVTGLLLGYLVNLALAGSGDWRLMLASGALPAVLLVAGLPLLPESPRWLVAHGRTEEARILLEATRSEAEAEVDLAQIDKVSEPTGSRRELFSRWVRPAVIVGVGIPILTQFTGLNIVTYYAPTIFDGLGIEHQNALAFTVILGAVKVAAVAVGLTFIDRVGRRRLFSVGSAVMAVCMLWMAYEAAKGDALNPLSMLIAMSAMFVGYSVTWGPVNWVVLGEIYPLRVRGAGMGLSGMITWAATLAITFGFPIMRDGWGLTASMIFFAACNVVGLVFVWRYVLETKGRTLEDIELDLRHRAEPAKQKSAVTAVR